MQEALLQDLHRMHCEMKEANGGALLPASHVGIDASFQRCYALLLLQLQTVNMQVRWIRPG